MVSKAEKDIGAGRLIRRARKRAGLSQRALAQRLETSQSLVARWENGNVSPSFDSVIAATRACGLELDLRLTAFDPGDDRLILQNLVLTPGERLDRMLQGARSLRELQAAKMIDG